MVDFQRPGDEFDQTEREFRRPSEGRWIYRPEDITPDNLNNELPAGADEKKDGEAALPEAAAAEE